MLILIITVLVVTIVISVFLLRRCSTPPQKQIQKNASWLIKNDENILKLVFELSYLPLSLEGLKRKEKKRKIDLILKLREKIRFHLPNTNNEIIHVICKDLVLISMKVRENR